jgi:hypothetical protein
MMRDRRRQRAGAAFVHARALALGHCIRLGVCIGLASSVCACDEGSPAAPVFEGGVSELATDAGLEAGPMYAVCPPDIDASYGSLLTQMFATSSCGTDRVLNCHSASGAAPRGTGNLLDFSVDAAAVYEQLLGDGGGHSSTNLSGTARVLRVVPGDASASMLYIKLILTAPADKNYGAGMPLDFPGSVCPEAVEAVKKWIDEGAPRN